MAEKKKKEKGLIFDKELPCPHCSKPVHIKISREVKKKSIPGEVEIKCLIERGVQKNLKDPKVFG